MSFCPSLPPLSPVPEQFQGWELRLLLGLLVIWEGCLKAEQKPPSWKELWSAAVTTLSALHTHF